jgi:phosphoserine phosphatase
MNANLGSCSEKIRAISLTLIAVVVSNGAAAADDPLPSWNDTATKKAIVDFVKAVTDPNSKSFVEPADRIAGFDNDGTLWCEKPTYVQVFFLFERIAELAPKHPEWKTQQPFRAVLEKDMKTLESFGAPELLKLVGPTHAGMTQEVFQREVERFFADARHPRWKRSFQELVYQPQLELMGYLRRNGFSVFIVTGGGRDFVRGVSETIYAVPKHMVTGSALQTEFQWNDDRGRLLRLPKLVEPLDDKAGKPVNIERDIGRRPILAFGNSDGDIQMLEYAISDERPWLSLLLHHDDAEREYAYDVGTEKALAIAGERGFTVVSMKNDFAKVFPFETR